MTSGWVAYTLWILWTKALFVSWLGWSGTARDFISLLRTVCSFQNLRIVYFWNCSLYILGAWLRAGNWNPESETADKGGTTVYSPHLKNILGKELAMWYPSFYFVSQVKLFATETKTSNHLYLEPYWLIS